MAKKCTHFWVKHTWAEPVNDATFAESANCADCGAVLSLGPSNDEPSAVQEEILAAELGQNRDVWDRANDLDRDVEDDLLRLGVRGFLSLGMLTPDAGHAYMTPPGFQDETDRRDYWAGWLAVEMAALSELDDAVDWDVTKPLAEQWPWNGKSIPCVLHPGNALAENGCTPSDVESFAELVGQTDQGQPVAPLSDDRNGAAPLTVPDAFAPVDSANQEPWHTTAETQLTDDELITRVAYSPPGSVRG